jgi:hypothetical protein
MMGYVEGMMGHMGRRGSPGVVEATPLRPFTLRLKFSDGLTGDVDLSEVTRLGGVFEPLHDPAYFDQVEVNYGTVVWPNGADMAPEVLYADAAACPIAQPSHAGLYARVFARIAERARHHVM